jgi:hypothetical protein
MEIQKRRKLALWHRLGRAIHTQLEGELPVLHATQRGELSERIIRLLTPQVCRKRAAVREAMLATLGVCVAIAPIAALQFVPRTESATRETAVLELDSTEPDRVTESHLPDASPVTLTPLFDLATPPDWSWSQDAAVIQVRTPETTPHSDGVMGVLCLPAAPSHNRALLWRDGFARVVRVGDRVTGYGEVQRIDESGVQLLSENGMLHWELRLRGERSDE